jgi:hypothetical protein
MALDTMAAPPSAAAAALRYFLARIRLTFLIVLNLSSCVCGRPRRGTPAAQRCVVIKFKLQIDDNAIVCAERDVVALTVSSSNNCIY